MLRLLSLSIFALLATQACAATSGDSSEQAQAAEQSRPANATTIVGCTDMEHSLVDATLTVDAGYRFTWQIGKMTPVVSTLTTVKKYQGADHHSYRLGLSTGEFVSLYVAQGFTLVSVGALQVACAPTTVVREERLSPALFASAWSLMHKRTFARCTFHGDEAAVRDDAFTVRPGLDGKGAIFESAFNPDAFVILARQLTSSSDHQGTTYKGEGGIVAFEEGQRPSPVTELTFSGSPVSAKWDGQEAMPSNECDVTGADYAASLIR